MTKMLHTALAATLAGALLLPSSALAGGDSPARPEARDVVETLSADGSFGTLIAALQAAGLVEALKGDGPFTLFAPPDDAFGRLPEGAVDALLTPDARPRLRRILGYHVVAGRVASTDLLRATSAGTLAGDALPIGLRVGDANVVRADVECSNGIVHVIDSVLIPPVREEAGAMQVGEVLSDAIDRGVPVFNDGDHAGCARIYREAAKRVVAAPGDALAALHELRLRQALLAPADDAEAEAWALRGAFDLILADLAFEPRVEAPLPEGFPGPGPVGRVVVKEYPGYRAARAEGSRAFWTLFEHIKSNEVQMTAPVEMTMDEGLRMVDMAFLYERTTQGAAGEQGAVAVLDLAPREVLSVGVRGAQGAADLALARRALEERLAKDGLEAAGPWRVLGYNSPMVPAAQRFWELQVAVAR